MARKPKISDEDVRLFRDTVRGVAPLRHDRAGPDHPTRRAPRPRRSGAGTPPERVRFPVSSETAPPVASDAALLFARDGVQPTTIRKLRRGQLAIAGTLDLHGMTTHEAAAALDRFIERSVQSRRRVVLVVHGKGYRSATHPVLKSYVNQGLRQHPWVLAFCSAQPGHGGAGAVYVLLKALR